MEIVKSVFQSKGKRYQFIRYCTVGTLAAGIHYLRTVCGREDIWTE